MNIDIQVERWPIERLIPRANNPRTHSRAQIAQIAASMKEWGWTNPILVGADDDIIAGHARLLAAEKLGMKEVPVIVLRHLPPAQRRALVIADNQLAIAGAGWDEEMLRNGNEALAALSDGAQVVGGTAWLWASEKFSEAVDVLFVDEAGQIALANVLAVSNAAKNIVLLGDPRQLEQPQRGSHPDGAEASALDHILGGAQTIPADKGLFLEKTWRLHPAICEFTSEVFYESRLASRAGLENQGINGHPWLGSSGLWFVPVSHEGNQNASPEEVERIAGIVEELLRPGTIWVDDERRQRALRPDDILIVAPYNAQVADLSAKLPHARVGTVDKFQGQQAPIVIYSMTASSHEDAPRGMEFLYSLNRLNVATSRAQAIVIVVGSLRLLEPECRSPRQMLLANALCRYAELAQVTQTAAYGNIRERG